MLTQLKTELTISEDLLFGSSDAMQHLRCQVEGVIDSGLPVLIEGESGTGKDLLSRFLHARSAQRVREYVRISCSGANLSSLETVFWGDGLQRRPAGMVVFDDIGELTSSGQAHLLATLQDQRISANDVQIVSTSKTPLRRYCESGAFRDDLYYRLNVVNLVLPPLRERRGDIPVLAEHFLATSAAAYRRQPVPFSQQFIDLLMVAEWPGNIRELENLVKRYVITGHAEAVIAEMKKYGSAMRVDDTSAQPSLKEMRRNAVRDCEYEAILSSLNRNHWNRRRTAVDLHISYRSLLYMMEQLGMPKKRSASVRTESGSGSAV
jgi:two-component system, NtrC family, response regulator AtoC